MSPRKPDATPVQFALFGDDVPVVDDAPSIEPTTPVADDVTEHDQTLIADDAPVANTTEQAPPNADAPAEPPVWEQLPVVGPDADEHALIVTASGSFTPSGVRRTGPVDTIDKLTSLIVWAAMTPLGVPAQVWIVGIDACASMGWSIDPGSEDDVDDLETLRVRAAELLRDTITATLAPMLTAGWELRGDPGHVVHLARRVGTATQMVDVILEPYSWTWWNRDFGWGNRVGDLGILGAPTAGTYLPDEDQDAARELGRRLALSARSLRVLPGPTAARTGAAVLDKIRRERLRAGKGLVVSTTGTLPPLADPPRGDLEPAAGWTRIPDADDLADAAVIVTIDQRAAYLASAGMLDLGHGAPAQLDGAVAADAAADQTTPFGLWRVTLPAGAAFALPEKLPLPHPRMQMDRPVTTWITTVSLSGLRAPVADGGMGLDLDDLAIDQAWVWPDQGRVLDKWAKVLRTARADAVDTGDVAFARFLSATYKGYIGRMVNPDMWTAERMRHHHQPVWRAAIMAHSRWRGRRVATRIGRETGRWPIRTLTDSWVYLLPNGLDIGDDSAALGKMVVEKTAPITSDHLTQLTDATTLHEVKQVISAIHGTLDDVDPDGDTPDAGQE